MVKKHTKESAKRSFVKALTFRTTIIIADTIITWVISHNYIITVGFVVFTNVASTIIYYLHERFWAQIEWGEK